MRERNESYAPWNQEEGPCDICKRSVDDCTCPECPACGAAGDPLCYDEHGKIGDCEQKPQEGRCSVCSSPTIAGTLCSRCAMEV